MTTTLPDRPPAAAAAELVKRLRAGFESGRTRPVDARVEQLRRLDAMHTERERELLDALAADLGKSEPEGFVTEVAFTRAEIAYALANLDAWVKPEKVSVPLTQQPAKARIVREPLGVALVIGPWNYPLQLLLAPLVAAIAAGNTVVLKPSELAPASSALLARLVPEYLDPEWVAVAEGGVDETTALLAERWDHIFYTGNGRVGRIVMEAAARHLTPVTLELGGKSPTIVDRHANLKVAARRIAWGKFVNAGQTCVAPDYVLVDRAVEQPFLDELTTTIRSFFGDDARTSADYGRIVNDRHFERLAGLASSGGDAIVGGTSDRADRYIAPTVLTGVDPGSPLMTEEIFGPLLPVLPVDDVDAAIEFVNAREKPLALYVFSESDSVVDRVVSSTTAGGMAVNATVLHLAVPGLPFGGVGASGMGAYHGRAGFETFSHRKSVLDRPTRLDVPVMYPPYSSWKQRLLRKVL